MPRYYFTIRWSDHEDIDPQGSELADDDVVLDYACCMIRRLQASGGYDNDPGLMLEVRNERRETVLFIPFLPAYAWRAGAARRRKRYLDLAVELSRAFALAAGTPEAERLREDVAFMLAIRANHGKRCAAVRRRGAADDRRRYEGQDGECHAARALEAYLGLRRHDATSRDDCVDFVARFLGNFGFRCR
jgi:hypothetical protein